MADEYKRNRFLRCGAIGCALAVAVGIGAVRTVRQESWVPLAHDSLAQIGAERAVSPALRRDFARVAMLFGWPQRADNDPH